MFLSVALSIGAIALLIQWNFGRGFLQYVNDRDNARAAAIAGRIAQRYETEGNWQWLTPRQWRRLTSPGGAARRPPPPPPDQWRRLTVPGGSVASRPPPPDRVRNGRLAKSGPSPVELGPRLTLFDASLVQLTGRPLNLNHERVVRHPVTVSASTVGWLAYQPLRKVRSLRDVDFLHEQSRSFLLTSALVLLAAGIVGYYFARHLTQPLTRLNQFVGELARGNYDQQIPVSRRDEIAGLSHNVNALAKTLSDNLSARQRWVADISHELRTPLAIVQGEIEALRDGIRTVSPESIESLHVEVLRLGKLIDDLHQLSLSDAGALNYRFESLALRPLLDEAVQKFLSQAKQHDLTLELIADQSKPLLINADPFRLRQLLDNLLENSLRYTDAGGKIQIRLSRKNNTVAIEVADTAPGVSVQDCERLFDRLYRVDSSRSRAHGGSGLGLAIAKNIVQAHQGNISARPSDLGGLSITVELPI